MDRVVRGVDARRTAGVDEGRPKPQPAPWVAPWVAPWCATVAVFGERLPAGTQMTLYKHCNGRKYLYE